MATEKIRLINKHDYVIGQTEVDIETLVSPDTEDLNRALIEGFARNEESVQSAFNGLTSNSTDEEIGAALGKALPDDKVLPVILEVLTEHLTEELHKELRPLAENMATRVTEEPELKSFFLGLLAGSRALTVQKIRTELDGKN